MMLIPLVCLHRSRDWGEVHWIDCCTNYGCYLRFSVNLRSRIVCFSMGRIRCISFHSWHTYNSYICWYYTCSRQVSFISNHLPQVSAPFFREFNLNWNLNPISVFDATQAAILHFIVIYIYLLLFLFIFIYFFSFIYSLVGYLLHCTRLCLIIIFILSPPAPFPFVIIWLCYVFS